MRAQKKIKISLIIFVLSLWGEARREAANLTEIKNLNTLVYGVKKFVFLSVCLPICL